MAILSSEITIPVLCPIQFAEATDVEFYPYQRYYVGKFNASGAFMILISPAQYASTDAIMLLASNIHGKVVKTYTLEKKILSAGFNYAECSLASSSYVLGDLMTFSLFIGAEELANSGYYEKVKVGYAKHLKVVEYTNSINDWNTVFGTFKINLECGFNPNDYTAKSSKQDFQDQSETNQKIYGQPYDTEILSIGGTQGIPNWLYKKVNAILMCDSIKIDGVSYELAQGAELEKIDQTYSGLGRYKIELQRTNTFAQ